jgi:hypothetical protein
VTAHPEVLVQLRDELVADAEGFNDHRRQHEIIRFGEDVKVRRSPQAVACRERYDQELGRPHRLLSQGSGSVGYTAIEARRGNLETGLCWNLSAGMERWTGRRRSTVEGKVRRMPMGSLIKRSTLSVGEPRTWGRT